MLLLPRLQPPRDRGGSEAVRQEQLTLTSLLSRGEAELEVLQGSLYHGVSLELYLVPLGDPEFQVK